MNFYGKCYLTFKGNTRDLLYKKYHEKDIIAYEVSRLVSIKDVIESFGVPHTEVDEILVNGSPISFDYLVKKGDYIEIYPKKIPSNPFEPTILRPETIDEMRFIVDVNVGKLAGLLRLMGFDVHYDTKKSDEEIAEISHKEKRILLTRDRGLLKRKIVNFGHLVRESHPYRQLFEVIHQYNLEKYKNPFSRCMRCNSILKNISKDAIYHLLEPLTRKYYEKFMFCSGCNRIYWEGSHFINIEKNLNLFRTGLG